MFRDTPPRYFRNTEEVAGTVNFPFSLGVQVSTDGKVQDGLWEGAAFDAGLTAGCSIVKIDGADFSVDLLEKAIRETPQGASIALRIRRGKQEDMVEIECPGGHRYPDLEPIEGARPRLREILSPSR